MINFSSLTITKLISIILFLTKKAIVQLSTHKAKPISVILLTCYCVSFLLPLKGQSGFVNLDTILQYGIIESIDFSSDNFLGDTVDGYESRKILLSNEAAYALLKAEIHLQKSGLGLKVLDGYRPQQAVDHFVRWSKTPTDTVNKRRYYPTLSKDLLFDKGYIAEKSGHSGGSAVDLTLFDLKTGKELDMGSDVDFFGPILHPQYDMISREQRKHREFLRTAMLEVGFAPLDTECWHFVLREEPFPNTYFNFPVE